MTLAEAGRTLRAMHQGAPHDEKVIHIILFGITYAESIESLSSTDIVVEARMTERNSYHQELNFGRRLAKYVTPRTDS